MGSAAGKRVASLGMVKAVVALFHHFEHGTWPPASSGGWAAEGKAFLDRRAIED